jgi:hypothetical protein
VPKQLIYIANILIVLVISGCQTNSTFLEQKLIVEDQAFSLSEKSPEGTLVGQVVVSNPDRKDLSYYLISGDYSQAFTLEESTGKLFVKDSSVINYDKVQQIYLKVMVGYSDSVMDYGAFANLLISIIDKSDSLTWISDTSKVSNQDANVNSLYGDLNYEESVLNYICAWTYNLDSFIIRTYLKFDLSSFPQNAGVISACLNMFNPHDTILDHTHSDSEIFGSNAFYIRRVNGPWNSRTITWNNQPEFIDKDKVYSKASQLIDQDYSIDVTEMVKEMIKNPESNYGFMIMLENESYYRKICFASLENPDTNLRPRLEINYQE